MVPDARIFSDLLLLDPCGMTTPRAVVFDMDGLMFNTEDVYFQVGMELMQRRGCEYTRELSDAVMGRPPQACFETMIRWHSLGERWEAMAAESEEVYIRILDDRLQPMPGLMELLAALESAGIPKAICTSSSRRLVEATLGRFQLQPRFLFTLTAEDIVHGKPHPEIYLKAAGQLGIAPAEMLVLEDSQTGCRAAAAAGAVVVAVPAAHSEGQDFQVATLIVESLADARLYEAIGLAPACAGRKTHSHAGGRVRGACLAQRGGGGASRAGIADAGGSQASGLLPDRGIGVGFGQSPSLGLKRRVGRGGKQRDRRTAHLRILVARKLDQPLRRIDAGKRGQTLGKPATDLDVGIEHRSGKFQLAGAETAQAKLGVGLVSGLGVRGVQAAHHFRNVQCAQGSKGRRLGIGLLARGAQGPDRCRLKSSAPMWVKGGTLQSCRSTGPRTDGATR